MCLRQAKQIEALRRKLFRHELNEISFIGVNSKIWHSQLSIKLLDRIVSFPLYQSTHGNDVFHILNGHKDDVFIYDRCGRLVYYIPFPRSYVRYRIVEAAIVSAYLDEPCGPCPTQATLKDASDHLAKHGIKIAMDSSKVDVKSDEAEEDNSSGEEDQQPKELKVRDNRTIRKRKGSKLVEQGHPSNHLHRKSDSNRLHGILKKHHKVKLTKSNNKTGQTEQASDTGTEYKIRHHKSL